MPSCKAPFSNNPERTHTMTTTNTTTRRNFLKGMGVTMALPWLESLGGKLYAADSFAEPRRLLLICLPLGIYRDAFIPSESGAGYGSTEYLKFIEAFRDQFTVISGLDHPGVNGGHSAETRTFTGQPSDTRNVQSLDQYLASKIGLNTRYDSLVLSSGRNVLSWTDGGTMVPSEEKMANIYAKLFLQDDANSTDRVLREIGEGKSIMDLVHGQAKALQPSLSRYDQQKLEEYFESVRETERRLVKSESWVHRPKPSVEAGPPVDPASGAEIVTQLRNVCDMTYLAFKTDSTRIITFGYFQQNNVNIEGVTNGYHPLSHHGKDPNNIAQLKIIESEFFVELSRLMKNLREAKEGDSTLLDRTTILVTSNLGNGSSHSNRDLPVLLAGGRYRHGGHLAYEPSTIPLSNLYLSILHQFGIQDGSFGTSTGPLQGFDLLG